jgi:hypothetical protein
METYDDKKGERMFEDEVPQMDSWYLPRRTKVSKNG